MPGQKASQASRDRVEGEHKTRRGVKYIYSKKRGSREEESESKGYPAMKKPLGLQEGALPISEEIRASIQKTFRASGPLSASPSPGGRGDMGGKTSSAFLDLKKD